MTDNEPTQEELSQEDQLRRLAELAGIKVAVAFTAWKTESERPEQDLNMQAVSDAWDLLMFREEGFRKAFDDLKLLVPTASICDDCG